MAALTQEQKEFLVTQLACFHSPSEVATQAQEEFGLKLSRQQVGRYNADTATGEELSAELKALFAERRQSFLIGREKIAITHQAFRERELLDLYRESKSKSPLIALKFLEQAAKEAGGMYERRTDDKGDDNSDPLPPEFHAAIDKIYGETAETEGAENGVSAESSE